MFGAMVMVPSYLNDFATFKGFAERQRFNLTFLRYDRDSTELGLIFC